MWQVFLVLAFWLYYDVMVHGSNCLFGRIFGYIKNLSESPVIVKVQKKPYVQPVRRLGDSPWIARHVDDVMAEIGTHANKTGTLIPVRLIKDGEAVTLDCCYNRINLHIDEMGYVAAVSYC
jgi:hypothetical protein